jgi:hypothetical protein
MMARSTKGMSPLLAQRYRQRPIDPTVGIGSVADMNGCVASANSVELGGQRIWPIIESLKPISDNHDPDWLCA